MVWMRVASSEVEFGLFAFRRRVRSLSSWIGCAWKKHVVQSD